MEPTEPRTLKNILEEYETEGYVELIVVKDGKKMKSRISLETITSFKHPTVNLLNEMFNVMIKEIDEVVL